MVKSLRLPSTPCGKVVQTIEYDFGLPASLPPSILVEVVTHLLKYLPTDSLFLLFFPANGVH
jgi:hypothetical protein